MNKLKDFLCERKEQLFEGELTLPKKFFWLIALNVFLLGILYGLLKAPLTHGLSIRCGNNNGNNNGNHNGKNIYGNQEDDMDDCECVGCYDLNDEDEDED